MKLHQCFGPSPSNLRTSLFAGTFVAVAVAITWPLSLHLGTHVPLGSESAATVPYFNLWTLWWNADRLTYAYQGYWDAPTFAPLKGTFAFSEPQFLTGLMAAPIWLTSQSITLGHNVILLVFLTLNGAATYILMRGLSVDDLPASLTAFIVEALPFVAQEMGVLQLTPLFGILLTLHYTFHYSKTGTVRNAVGLGLSFAVTFLMSGQYALLLSLLLLVLSPIIFQRNLLRWQPLVALFAGVGIGAALLAPIAVRQASFIEGYGLERSLNMIENNSAELQDYARLPRATLGYRMWNATVVPMSGQRLYPGTGIVLLGLWGLVTGLHCRNWRRWTLFFATGVVVALVFSLGPTLDMDVLGLPNWQPYELLRTTYPGMQQFRSPFRFGVFAQIFFAMLAGLGLHTLYQNWRWRGRTYVVIGIAVLALAEVFPAPVTLAEVPTHPNEDWITWLASQPEGTIVAHVPFPEGGKTSDLEQTTEWMLYQMWHGQRIANGYSGFSPTSYRLLWHEMRNFPSEDSLEILRQRDVSYVLLDRDWLTTEKAQELSRWDGCFATILESPSIVVLELIPHPGCPYGPRERTLQSSF
jgi:hypothetical protein